MSFSPSAQLVTQLAAIGLGSQVSPSRDHKLASGKICDDFHALCRSLRTDVWDHREQFGFEVEGVIVDQAGRPAFVADEVLKNEKAPKKINLGGELISSNLECSPGPHLSNKAVFQELFSEIVDAHKAMKEASESSNSSVALCGMLPSYIEGDFSLEVLTSRRAHMMNDFLLARRGGSFPLSVTSFDGKEQFNSVPESMAIEGITTSLQVQMSGAPHKLPGLYNASLLAMSAVLAGAGNSPFICGTKGWHESRIGLLQNGVTPERFFLSSGWANNPEDLFRDILDFEAIKPPEAEDTLMKEKDSHTRFEALRGHNGTVWKWVRPCLGQDENGLEHMRLELRSLPAGPSALDQVANAAMLICLVHGLARTHPDLPTLIKFDDVLKNHEEAARMGLSANFSWIDGEEVSAKELLLTKLIPLARKTAKEMNFDASITHDGQTVDLFDVFEMRVVTGQTGSQWAFDSVESLELQGIGRAEALCQVTQAMIVNQQNPLFAVSSWPILGAAS